MNMFKGRQFNQIEFHLELPMYKKFKVQSISM